MKKPRWSKFAVAICGSLVASSPVFAESNPEEAGSVGHLTGRLVSVQGRQLTLSDGRDQYRLALEKGQACPFTSGDYVEVDYHEGNKVLSVAKVQDPQAPAASAELPSKAESPVGAGPAVDVVAEQPPASEGPVQEETPAPSESASPAGPSAEGQTETPAPASSPAPAETPAVPAEQPKTEPSPVPEAPPAETDQNQPHIVNIEIEGNTNVPADEILQVVSTRIGDPLLEPRLKRDAQAIFDLGYFTDVRLDYRLAPGGVRLVFRVLENPVVNEIHVTGTDVVSPDKVVSLMETKSGKILNTRFLRSDIEAVNQYYNEELGYLLNNHVEDLTFEKGVLTLKIKDGMRIQQVVVEGATVFPVERLQSLIRLKPGDLFNKKTSDQDSAAIAKLYEDNDYILDAVRPTIDVDKGLVTFRVQEAMLEEVRVEGNSRTTTDTVLRNMRSKPGEVLQKRRLQRDVERLQNLGFFKKVEINPEPGTEPGKVILVLDVEEQKSGLATIGLGYAGGGTGALRPGVTGSVSLSDRNLFGEGKTYNIQLQAGGQVRSAGVSYLDPAINDNQDSIGVSVYYSQLLDVQQSVIVNGSSQFALYDDERYGISATYGHPFTDDLRGFVTLRHDQLNIQQSPDSTFTPLGLGKGSINGIAFNAIYDTRDDLFNPHVGTYGAMGLSHAGLGGTFDFNKYTAEVRHYIPIADRHTIALRGWYGTVSGGSIPGSEFFYAGGVDTLRGFTQNRFVGTRFLVMNAEYRFPLGNIKFLNGAVFADVGNAWFPGVTSDRLRIDGGIGLRIVFPSLGLGVIRVDYAFSDEGGRASIGIGQSF